MKNLIRLVFPILLLGVMMGCTGKMDGVIRRDASRIDIMYSDSRVSAAELVAVLPDGEHFRGKSEKFDRTKEILETSKTGIDDGSEHFKAVQTFAGNAIATLSGSRGNLIECRFKLADIIIGYSGGGFGICQISDGRIIDVFF